MIMIEIMYLLNENWEKKEKYKCSLNAKQNLVFFNWLTVIVFLTQYLLILSLKS